MRPSFFCFFVRKSDQSTSRFRRLSRRCRSGSWLYSLSGSGLSRCLCCRLRRCGDLIRRLAHLGAKDAVRLTGLSSRFNRLCRVYRRLRVNLTHVFRRRLFEFLETRYYVLHFCHNSFFIFIYRAPNAVIGKTLRIRKRINNNVQAA